LGDGGFHEQHRDTTDTRFHQALHGEWIGFPERGFRGKRITRFNHFANEYGINTWSL
jgi:hypothetical protein